MNNPNLSNIDILRNRKYSNAGNIDIDTDDIPPFNINDIEVNKVTYIENLPNIVKGINAVYCYYKINKKNEVPFLEILLEKKNDKYFFVSDKLKNTTQIGAKKYNGLQYILCTEPPNLGTEQKWVLIDENVNKKNDHRY